jgi:hypothetical protein
MRHDRRPADGERRTGLAGDQGDEVEEVDGDTDGMTNYTATRGSGRLVVVRFHIRACSQRKGLPDGRSAKSVMGHAEGSAGLEVQG